MDAAEDEDVPAAVEFGEEDGAVWSEGAVWDEGADCDEDGAVCDGRTDAPASNREPAKQIALTFAKESFIA